MPVFALWSGDRAALRRVFAQVTTQHLVVIVREPGATIDRMVERCADVSIELARAGVHHEQTQPPQRRSVSVGLNVGGAERGGPPELLITRLLAGAAPPPTWLQLPERAEPPARFAGLGAQLLRSCHDLPGIARAFAQGADSCTLSPIWPTASKPGAPGLGLDPLRVACARWPGRVVALGGVDVSRLAALREVGVAGIAVRAAVWQDPHGALLAQLAHDEPGSPPPRTMG